MSASDTRFANQKTDPSLEQLIERQLLKDFNNTITPYPRNQTLTDLFEQQVLRNPDAVALRRHDATISYKDLNKKANQLARYLIAHGVKNKANVGLLVSRNFDMIIGMLAILKTGAAYVPIDPEYPLDRQQYILQNSAAELVITDSQYALTDCLTDSRLIKLYEINLKEVKDINPQIKIDSEQLAYTIYTSGSTGSPKGVMIEHHMAVNLVTWVNSQFSVCSDDCLLFITSMCFDLSVYDIFGLLAAGGSIVVVDKQELMDAPKLQQLLTKHNVTFWDSVPSTMDYLISELEANGSKGFPNKLRLVFMSGDWIPVNLPDRIKKYFPEAQNISLGGATEGTVWSNYYPIEKVDSNWTSIPYGKPISNNFFYILDEKLQQVPIGEVGELYIGGVGVARGYANDKEKTNLSFMRDPFNNRLGGRMYKTGDYGRMLPTMDMEFIGRVDDQVKIRGFRVELGEIGSALQKHQNIKAAVVLARTVNEHDKELVAYIVGDTTAAELKGFLKEKLPDYMIPGQYVKLDAIPLTGNGKVDRKALLLQADIWTEALGVKQIGVYDNFFELGGKRLPLASLFEKPTVEKLAQLLNFEGKPITWDSLVPIKTHGDRIPLYIVHGAGLNVLLFNAVAMGLSADQPVYGLQAKGLNGTDEPFNCIEDMAAYYIEAIMRQNPDGPYALSGFSFGGIIAYEMARQFEAMGKEVKLLAVFDTYAYRTSFYDPFAIKVLKKLQFYSNSVLHTLKFTNGFKNTIKEKWMHIKRKLIRVYWSLKPGEDENQTGFFGYAHKIDKCNFYAQKRYLIKPQNIAIDVFKAQIRTFYVHDKKYLGWQPYALKGVRVHELPGEHNTIFKAPNDKIFAEVLQKCLDNITVEQPVRQEQENKLMLA
eukprot:gene12436-12523_t